MPRTHKRIQHAARKEDEEMQEHINSLEVLNCVSCVSRREDIYYSSKESEKDKGLGFEEIIWLFLNPSINCWDLKSSQNLKRNNTDKLTYKTETHRFREWFYGCQEEGVVRGVWDGHAHTVVFKSGINPRTYCAAPGTLLSVTWRWM